MGVVRTGRERRLYRIRATSLETTGVCVAGPEGQAYIGVVARYRVVGRTFRSSGSDVGRTFRSGGSDVGRTFRSGGAVLDIETA